jgi:glycosyltransferase involved in cell wall biosynthesis
VPDLIDPGEHGLLVERRDPAAAGALAELLAEPERHAGIGAAARARHRAAFDLGVMVGRLKYLYVRRAAGMFAS